MMYGGLRGAVAFALVLLIDPKVCFHSSQWQGAQLGELISEKGILIFIMSFHEL